MVRKLDYHLESFLDFSLGSSDNYTPNSETDSSETSTSTSKPKKRYTKFNLIIPKSSDDSDSSTTEPQPGCSHSNKKQREFRILLRNAGKGYVTKMGKMKPGKNLGPLTDCRVA